VIATASQLMCAILNGLAALSHSEPPILKPSQGSLELIYWCSFPKIPARISSSQLRATPFATLHAIQLLNKPDVQKSIQQMEQL